jgi:hypothetical protein
MLNNRKEWPDHVLSDPHLAECWSKVAHKDPTFEERQEWHALMCIDPRLKACYEQAVDSVCPCAWSRTNASVCQRAPQI